MNPRRAVPVLLASLLAVLLPCLCLADNSVTTGATTSSVAGAAATTRTSDGLAVNTQCPVMPDKAADESFELIFRRVPVRFCCGTCLKQFEQNPEPYLARLAHVPPAEPAAKPSVPQRPPLLRRVWLAVLVDLPPFVERWQRVLVLLLSVLVVQWVCVRTARKLDPQSPSAGLRGSLTRLARGVVQAIARPTTFFLLLAGVVAGHMLGPRQSLILSPGSGSAASIPPERTMQSRMAHQRLLQGEQFVTGLDKTYYRGNDDRSPALYQGGIYRTCSMPIRLQTADGKPVRPGDDVKGKRLVVRVEIVRAASTLKSHFTDADLQKAFLISREVIPSEPRDGADADAFHSFKIVEPGERWAAECDIGEVTDVTKPITGLVLLVPGTTSSSKPAEAWPHAHYGVQYEINFDPAAGTVAATSKLWMAATFFTETLPDERMYEWLSWKPLPEIPAGFDRKDELH